MSDIADDLVCAITQELPVDPVIAEDGRIYERAAISQWIHRQGARVRSPMTNEAMGPQLHPAIQVRNTIEKLIQSGVICADMVARFTERLKEAEEVKAMLTRAEGGDDTAMLHLAIWYQYGHMGLPQQSSDCFRWFQRAAKAGNPRGIACAGECYISGEGVPQQEAYGLHLMTMAAERGSEAGAFCLGLWYVEGLHGLPVNAEQSKYWLSKIVNRSCAYPGLSVDARELANALFNELKNPESDRQDALFDSCSERFLSREGEGWQAE
jgi:TPR repeat protein